MPTYQQLPLLPNIAAEVVCRRPYTGHELSNRSAADVARIEAARQRMTPADVREFADLCDRRCEDAYNACASWFMQLAQEQSNAGRDQLYVWLSHWLASYLTNPEVMRGRR